MVVWKRTTERRSRSRAFRSCRGMCCVYREADLSFPTGANYPGISSTQYYSLYNMTGGTSEIWTSTQKLWTV